MRKSLIFALTLCLMLTGCSRGGEKETAAYATVLRGELPITLSAPAGPVLTALGAPFGYGEHSGRTGVEKTYRFAGLRLETLEDRKGERILGITVTGEGISVPDGIAVGDSAAQVRALFGADAVQGGRCTVCRGREKLEILLQDGIVAAISYSLL